MVFFGGVYQKELHILEWSFLFNLILLSAIYNPWYGKLDTQQVITVISMSAAFAVFIVTIVFHTIVRVKNIECFEKFFKCCKIRNSEESERLLENEENRTCQQLVQPTSSDVWLRRESLLH